MQQQLWLALQWVWQQVLGGSEQHRVPAFPAAQQQFSVHLLNQLLASALLALWRRCRGWEAAPLALAWGAAVSPTRLAPTHSSGVALWAQLGLRVQRSLLAHHLQPRLAQAARLDLAAVGVVLPQQVCLGHLQVQASWLDPLAAAQECRRSHLPAQLLSRLRQLFQTCQCSKQVMQLRAHLQDARQQSSAGALEGSDL